jgi:sortase A
MGGHKRIIALMLLTSGLTILTVVILPLLYSQWNYFKKGGYFFDPSEVTINTRTLAAETISVDYTNANNWFAPSVPLKPVESKVGYYTLSVPSVKLKDVPVEINGVNLKKNAIQYPGTALPGTFGNPVIFGHSTLPYLYKVNDPISIFNPLLKVKKGDEVIVDYDGITFRYRVAETWEVSPDKVEVLAQRYDKHELTLITCIPLGTYLHRFVVRAELVN